MTRMVEINFVTALILLVCVSGCATTAELQRSEESVPKSYAPPEASILVSLHRLGTVRVPIPRNGMTLRRTVGDARDLASQGGDIVLTHAINILPPDELGAKPANAGISSSAVAGAIKTVDDNDSERGITSEDLKLFVEEECIVVARGNTLMIVPELLVTGTGMGSSRVFPGDVIQTIPFQLVNTLRDSLSNGQVIVSSDHFAARTIRLSTETTLESVSDFVGWEGFGSGARPSLNPDLLPPNVVAISRSFQGAQCLLIFPCQVIANDETAAPDELLSVKSRVQNRINELSLANGDVVHFTRLENIPTVALGLSLPVPDRVSSVAGPESVKHCLHENCDLNGTQVGGKSIPGGAAISRTQQHLTENFKRLLSITQ